LKPVCALHRRRQDLPKQYAQLTQPSPPIQVDRLQLQQVMLNLLVNGIQAMSDDGVQQHDLQITTDTVVSEDVRVGVRDARARRSLAASFGLICRVVKIKHRSGHPATKYRVSPNGR
jgi:signal transduction histidine kinase